MGATTNRFKALFGCGGVVYFGLGGRRVGARAADQVPLASHGSPGYRAKIIMGAPPESGIEPLPGGCIENAA
jgi:hypothetical protein